MFAISEAAAVSVVYALFLKFFLYKDISVRQLPEIANKVHGNGGRNFVDSGIALAFTSFLVDAEVPKDSLILFRLISKAQSPFC